MKYFFYILPSYFFLIAIPNCFSEPSTPSHQKSQATFSRPVATDESPLSSPKEGRFFEDTFQYRDKTGNWKSAALYYRTEKPGTFLNNQGETITYSKGDILFKVQGSGWFRFEEVELTEVERLVIQFTNEERVKRGLPALKVSPRLQDLSRQKARNMARSQNLSHGVSPRPPGGENIAWNQANAREVVRAWMNSSGHRANILNARYSVIGVGMAQGNGPYWAQMFQ